MIIVDAVTGKVKKTDVDDEAEIRSEQMNPIIPEIVHAKHPILDTLKSPFKKEKRVAKLASYRTLSVGEGVNEILEQPAIAVHAELIDKQITPVEEAILRSCQVQANAAVAYSDPIARVRYLFSQINLFTKRTDEMKEEACILLLPFYKEHLYAGDWQAWFKATFDNSTDTIERWFNKFVGDDVKQIRAEHKEHKELNPAPRTERHHKQLERQRTAVAADCQGDSDHDEYEMDESNYEDKGNTVTLTSEPQHDDIVHVTNNNGSGRGDNSVTNLMMGQLKEITRLRDQDPVYVLKAAVRYSDDAKQWISGVNNLLQELEHLNILENVRNDFEKELKIVRNNCEEIEKLAVSALSRIRITTTVQIN